MNAIERILREFCNEVGIADADTVVSTSEIVVDGLTVAMLASDEEGDGLTLFAELGSPDESGREGAYRRLLEANFLWRGTGGGVLGIHPGTGTVGLCARIDLDGLDGKLLADIANRFITVAQYWQSALHAEAPVDGGGPPSMEMMHMLRG